MDRLKEWMDQGIMSGLDKRIPHENLLHMLMDGISDYIFFMEVVGPRRFKYVDMNYSARNHSLIKGAEWQDKYIEDLLGEDQAEELITAYESVVQNKEPMTYEDEIIINGKVFRGHSILTPMLDENVQVTHIVTITRNITEVIEKERDLRRINAMYRSLMKDTTDAILIVGMDGSILEANRAFEKLYGFTKEELQSSIGFPFVPENHKREAEDLLFQAQDGAVAGYETVRIRKNGRKIDVSISASPIQNEEGETIGISSIVRDISEEKEAQRKLEASRSRYRSLFEYNPQPILTLTFQGAITNANTASLRLLDKEEEELLDTSVLEWVPHDQVHGIREQLLESFFQKGIGFDTHFFVKEEERIVHVSLVPIISEGKKEGIYAILEDRTEQVRAHEALRQSEEKFRLIADHSNDLISVFSPRGELIYSSPSQQKFLGRNPMNMPLQELRQQIDPEGVSNIENAFLRSSQNKEAFTVSLRLTSRNGEPVWFECRGTPVISEHGEVSHFVIVARDISEQKNYEEKLEKFAFYDYLTDLPNRRLFEDRVEQAIVQFERSGQSFALLYLDGDGFKSINDRYGHEIGDEFLRGVGKRMKECTRAGDSVGRIGGDEFAILLENIEDRQQI
ncbi:PAS domain S-box-containing protein/diguanylate cyclase (GGDEF) domain-containing protein [Halobacillus dabanensis]|uniref:PAS domain S-box-containing protein/diguanylate cyclase (GGDEF) domain-containing protein n=1 Tax=Halobacillus dabanensis TaxID=240302 RepID=A0A1I3RH36_HALDA|nr:PAS domain S-box-containing protein/diguanylate cyclase (GGDEF) domain-containing protein [Halobacillus dabanensis]